MDTWTGSEMKLRLEQIRNIETGRVMESVETITKMIEKKITDVVVKFVKNE